MSNAFRGLRALLLAGGVGSRLRPITYYTPKCLVDVGGKPLLGHWLDMLFKAKIERVLINTHHLSEQVESFCDKSPHRSKIDLINEPELLGTAATFRANRNYFGDTTLLAHADNFTVFNPSDFIARHLARPSECIGTMMTFKTDSPKSCGIVELDRRGILIGYHEKVANPPGSIANAAVFLLDKRAINLLDLDPEAKDFCKDLIPLGIGRFQTYFNGIYHRDIGTIASLNQANHDFKDLVTNFN